ncbi:UDP-N-acetylglucosamine 1-carboxyvinyltransferase [Candidatus Bandiella numerosa]|jgi:UDP-N-acetylglucosamine 1-carboxyvinyltransferase|uniref:UDP-N-acetylglucosamine 1-carboxyvinyltransferase n=1 Tax=Candidatus Bandiella numerosa TaxID=2570586 RepID=UPI00249F171F|nr:UDP-N-acetylglucosamine 1-carboxyvinyltransferase [Candidatus Bandiella numerosa]WHA04896.1 UDP-N-acetylglucosamine 1-carboxyvinyltransferase [Candidatus Bandiella numerosa]
MQSISYIIQGGIPIHGRISCMGAKNLATKAMVAALLSSDQTVLRGMPNIGDVEITKELLMSAGVKVDWRQDINIMHIDATKITEHEASLPDTKTNRVPILLLSILLHRLGKAIVPTVGGDHIGQRNVDYHVEAIRKFGAEVNKKGNKYIAESKGRLKAAHIELPYPSVGATETCLFLSVLAEGTSIINNIALEPEIIELITMLRSMGAIIFLSGNRELIVQGVEKLSGTNFFLAGDRIEAASWASLACASNGEIEVSGIRPDLLGNFLPHFNKIGGGFKFLKDDSIVFFRKENLKSTEIETDVYPGFSTDWQQPFATILTQANGISVIHETVHEKRFGYLDILNKLGAKTETVSSCLGSVKCRYRGQDHLHSALIHGPTKLKSISSPLITPDLRAGLAYLIAAVLAEGETRLDVAEQIERGYGNLLEKLKNTNIKLKRIEN